jgi:hypothetical protein
VLIREIRGHEFLNCTKNIELTPVPFRSYIHLALTNKNERKKFVTAAKTLQDKLSNGIFSGQAVMKSVEWKTYRTRFLVKAKQLNSTLSFTDHLGRQHCGRKGDYLVESCDGVLSITPRRIFEDVYVPMGLTPDSPLPAPLSNEEHESSSSSRDNLPLASLRMEPLHVEKLKSTFRDEMYRSITEEKTPRTNRKSPQPVRVAPSRLGLM